MAILILVGIAVGAALAVVAARALSPVLGGVESVDPVAFGVAIGLMGIVALVASWLPARRATRVDPLVALRSE
jgi:putative ABC transport system permease protein